MSWYVQRVHKKTTLCNFLVHALLYMRFSSRTMTHQRALSVFATCACSVSVKFNTRKMCYTTNSQNIVTIIVTLRYSSIAACQSPPSATMDHMITCSLMHAQSYPVVVTSGAYPDHVISCAPHVTQLASLIYIPISSGGWARVECPEKHEVSTTLSHSTSFNHRAMVEDETGPCGASMARNNCGWFLLHASVRAMYSFKRLTVCWKSETSHTLVYLGLGGLVLNTPLRSLDTKGCCPTGKPSTGRCVDEMADRYTFKYPYSVPREAW